MAKLEFDIEHCKSCGYCIHFCPHGVLEIGQNANAKGYRYVVAINEGKCVGCAICATMCPDSVVEVYR